MKGSKIPQPKLHTYKYEHRKQKAQGTKDSWYHHGRPCFVLPLQEEEESLSLGLGF